MGPKSEEEYFRVCNGQVLTNLQELINALKDMDNDSYCHHVRGKKENDFATWIRDVFGQRYLARAMELAKSKEEMVKVLFIHQFA